MIKVGTIGTGFIVEWFLTSVADNEGIECIAVYSRSEEKGRKLADKYNVEKVYTDFDKMLEDEEINFIYVASPNSLHFEHTLKSLNRGKNVITEKPFTTTVTETEMLISVAKAKQLFLFEAITTIYMPNFHMIKEKLNLLGRIRMVQCNYSQYSSRYDKLLSGEVTNVFDPDFGGGALVDLNIYNLHFCCGLFGIPNDIHYYANKWENGIDTSGVLILTYPDFYCTCVGAKDSNSQNLTQVQGEKGYLQVSTETGMCRGIHIKTKEIDEVYELQEKMISLYYEVGAFVQIFEHKDYQTCYQKLEYTKQIVELLVKARASANIVFTNKTI